MNAAHNNLVPSSLTTKNSTHRPAVERGEEYLYQNLTSTSGSSSMFVFTYGPLL